MVDARDVELDDTPKDRGLGCATSASAAAEIRYEKKRMNVSTAFLKVDVMDSQRWIATTIT